jgi:nicotinamide phosphoribosyltransferase
MFSYLESRGGEYSHTLFFGLQYYLKEYLTQRITMEHVDEAEEVIRAHGLPFNRKGWERIVKDLGGRWPVLIKAVAEGSVIPTGNILMSVESTDPETFWAASFLETALLKATWYPTTVATQSLFIKMLITSYLDKTSDNPDAELPFKLHDFGYRGVSSEESAMIGGMGHLVNFMGTDTVAALVGARRYYNEKMAGFSIPATEHSTMTMWGKDREANAYANLLEAYKDQPIFACVSDSYDIINATKNIWGGALKDKVIDYKGTLVIRPDSGEPTRTCLDVIMNLDNAFGSTVNSKGFKVLNHGVRIIQGDGVNYESIKDILFNFAAKGYSASNIAFGMGGALLQRVDRDTQKFAFKCSAAEIEGKWVDVFKDPVTDNGKRSKKGLLDLNESENGEVHTVRRGDTRKSLLVDVYKNGEILKEYTFSEIRENSKEVKKQYKGWQHRPVY